MDRGGDQLRIPSIVVSTLVFPCWFIVGPVLASPIRCQFTGTIDEVWATNGTTVLSAAFLAILPFQIGDEEVGAFTYDTAATDDLFPDDPEYPTYLHWIGLAGNLDWDVGGQQFRRDQQAYVAVEVSANPDVSSLWLWTEYPHLPSASGSAIGFGVRSGIWCLAGLARGVRPSSLIWLGRTYGVRSAN